MTPASSILSASHRNAKQSDDANHADGLREVARQYETMIRSRMESHQRDIAMDMGISETKLSRCKTGESGLSVSDMALFLAALTSRGIFLCESSTGMVLVPEEKLSALTVLAKEALG